MPVFEKIKRTEKVFILVAEFHLPLTTIDAVSVPDGICDVICENPSHEAKGETAK